MATKKLTFHICFNYINMSTAQPKPESMVLKEEDVKPKEEAMADKGDSYFI